MTVADPIGLLTRAGPPPAFVEIDPDRGWRHLYSGLVSLWFKGEADGPSPERLVRRLDDCGLNAPDPAAVVAPLGGHFAFVATGPGWALAAVDRIRSTPLLFTATARGIAFAAEIRRLAALLTDRSIDADAALAVAMSGATIDTDTLYPPVSLIAPGEAVVVTAAGVSRTFWHRFQPWTDTAADTAADGPALGRRLLDVLIASLERLARTGRPVVVALDAAADGWIVAAGLRQLGCHDVRCVSIGTPGEALVEAGRRFAEALGYRWRAAPSPTPAALAQPAWREFVAAVDAGCATPVAADWPALQQLRRDAWLPEGAIVVNDGSGEDLAGGWIAEALQQPRPDLDAAGRRRLVVAALMADGFRLWQALATAEHDARVRVRLEALLTAADEAAADPSTCHGLAEFAALRNRLGKVVLAGPRTAEAVGQEWRLPLLDDDLVAFWQRAPLSAKAGRGLLRETLIAANWAGVWRRWPVPDAGRRAPWWLRWLARPALATVAAPLGREEAARLRHRWLDPWQAEPVMAGVVPAAQFRRDQRGAANALAWRTEAYLQGHGLDYAGRLIPSDPPPPAADSQAP